MGIAASRQNILPLAHDVQVGAQRRWNQTPIGPEPWNALHEMLTNNCSTERFIRDITYFEAVELKFLRPELYYRWIDTHKNLTRCNITEVGRNGHCRYASETIHLPECGHKQMEGACWDGTDRGPPIQSLADHRRSFRNGGSQASFTDPNRGSLPHFRSRARPSHYAGDDNQWPGYNRGHSPSSGLRSQQQQTARPNESLRRASRTTPRGSSLHPHNRTPVSRGISAGGTSNRPNRGTGGNTIRGGATASHDRASSRGTATALNGDTSRRSSRPLATTTDRGSSTEANIGDDTRGTATSSGGIPATGNSKNVTPSHEGRKEVVTPTANGQTSVIRTTKEEKHTVVTKSREETHATTIITEEIPVDGLANQRTIAAAS